MMLMDTEFTLFLTHVGNLTTVKSNQRRFAPTPAHITGITCPHHRNTHLEAQVALAALNRPHKRPVDAAFIGEAFLGVALLRPQFSDPLPKSPQEQI